MNGVQAVPRSNRGSPTSKLNAKMPPQYGILFPGMCLTAVLTVVTLALTNGLLLSFS